MRQLLYWLCAALIVTALYATIIGVAQTVLRSEANDPQLQLAEDAAAQLSQGQAATKLIGRDVDLATSLAPFLVIYDRQGQVLGSSGRLDGQIPTLPAGVLHGVLAGGERTVTWQPQSGIRVAAVVVGTDQGYVLSGRSLREVERRTRDLETFILVAWMLSIGLLGLTFLLSRLLRPARVAGAGLSFRAAA